MICRLRSERYEGEAWLIVIKPSLISLPRTLPSRSSSITFILHRVLASVSASGFQLNSPGLPAISPFFTPSRWDLLCMLA